MRLPGFLKRIEPTARFFFGMVPGRRTSKKCREAHYRENLELEKRDCAGDYIYNQDRFPHLRMGQKGETGECGCELMAVYNMLRYMEFSPMPYLSDIIRTAEEKRCLALRGAWGTNPFKIPVIIKHYIDDAVVSRFKKWDKMGDSGSYIVSFWNDKNDLVYGVHTVFFAIDKDGKVRACNLDHRHKSDWSEYRDFGDFCEKMRGVRLIVGYKVERSTC